MKLEQEFRNENEIVRKNVQTLKEFIDIDLPNLNAKIESESEERAKNIQNLVQEMNNEFSKVHESVSFIVY